MELGIRRDNSPALQRGEFTKAKGDNEDLAEFFVLKLDSDKPGSLRRILTELNKLIKISKESIRDISDEELDENLESMSYFQTVTFNAYQILKEELDNEKLDFDVWYAERARIVRGEVGCNREQQVHMKLRTNVGQVSSEEIKQEIINRWPEEYKTLRHDLIKLENFYEKIKSFTTVLENRATYLMSIKKGRNNEKRRSS